MAWRLVPLESSDDSFMKMAKEEAVMDAVREGRVPPTLRFYEWRVPAVCIGFFQEAEKEVDLERCKKDGVEVVRRLTGGGAVFKSPGNELNYSFVIGESHPAIPKEIEESYGLICGAVMKGLGMLGFETEFKPVNDILIGGRKVSGNAQTRVENCLLQHGTVLFSTDAERMFRYLKISDEKLRKKRVKKVEELVTGLREHGEATIAEVAEAIVKGFEETFGESFEKGKLTDYELGLAKEYYEKYAGEEWNSWR